MRYRSTGPRDTPAVQAGDRGFVGVNMRLEADKLPPGYVSEAINCRFNRGVAETRPGYSRPVWANKCFLRVTSLTRSGTTATATTEIAHGLSTGASVTVRGADQSAYNLKATVTVTGLSTFTYTVTGSPATPATGDYLQAITGSTYSWGSLHGLAVFSDPRTFQEYLVIAANGRTFFTQAHNVPFPLALPAGVTLDGEVEFEQCFDVLLMFRGEDQPPLQWRGVGYSWENVSQSPAGDGTLPIPNATRGKFFQNRLLVPTQGDEIAVSDFNDYTRYAPVVQQFRINQGSADRLVAIEKFGDNTLIAFKERSIYAIYQLQLNLDAVVLDEITHRFGCVAANSIAAVGKDLWFLSEQGVMSLTLTEENKIKGVVLPVSEPIQPLIERIHWRSAHKAQAVYHDNKYFLSVPLDDAEAFGPELWRNNSPLRGSTQELNLPTGVTYRYVPGSGTDGITVDGTDYLSVATFTPATSPMVLEEASFTSQASIRRVYQGVNTAVLVYDFLNQAWSGYDLSEGTVYGRWVRPAVLGRRELMFSGEDGWVRQIQAGAADDQLNRPYTDVEVIRQPVTGDVTGQHLRVNQGDNILAESTDGNNEVSPPQWGLGEELVQSVAILNLWESDGLGAGGFSPASPSQWTSPGAQATPLSTGVRFYGDNGLAPVATWDGTVTVRITQHGTQGIPVTLTTRAYTPENLALESFQWAHLDLQTWGPNYSVYALTNGVAEEETLAASQTKDRTAYYTYNTAAFDPGNGDGRFNDPYRKDYSVALGPGAGEASSFSIHTSTAGVPLDRHQEARESFRMNSNGRSLRLKVVNTTGRLRLMQALVEGQSRQGAAGSHAT